ncbi:MAG TPA: FkbM family methyltransferase [Candidatus Acidoferrales bacterium]|nr:FkbM family methyltransferase [Candidatus Acidoferrales bacterium]
MELPLRLRARFLRGTRTKTANRLREQLGWEQAPFSEEMRKMRRRFGDYLETRACGRPFIVDLRDTIIGPAILYYNVWEPEKTEFFRRLLRPGDRVVDIGANIGYFTVLFASAVAPDGKVLAIEPDADNLRLLEENVRINGLSATVQVAAAAAGERSGEHYILAGTGVANRGDHRTFGDAPGGGARRAIAMVMVDDLVAAWPSIALIKMDVQGFEYFALQGMLATLRRCQNIALVTEFWPSEMRRAQSDPERFIAELAALGMEAWTFERSGRLEKADALALARDLEPKGGSADLLFQRPAAFLSA